MPDIADFNPNLLDYIHELSIEDLEKLSEYALFLIDMKERIYGEGYDYFEEFDS